MRILLFLLLWPALLSAELKSDSFYHLDTDWIDQTGKAVRLKEFEGHPVVIAMVYMSCSFLCPMITSDIQKIEAKLPPKIKDDVRFILVSFDPERDTPEKMQEFMKKRKLDPQRWRLLTNKNQARLRELAGVLNFKYKKMKDGEFSHSYVVSVLDRGGSPVARVEGANQDAKPIVEFLLRP